MALCCIGGVCIPYTALVPFFFYGLQWLLAKFAAWGLLPEALHERLKGYLPAKSEYKGEITEVNCCAGQVLKVESDQQWHSLLKTKDAVVCKFTADWCGPCKKIQPLYEQLACEFSKSASFCLVDVDDLEDIAADYKVAMMPTFLVLKKGEEVARVSGSDEQKLRDLVKNGL